MTARDSTARMVRLFDHRVRLELEFDVRLPPSSGEPDLVVTPADHDAAWLTDGDRVYVSPHRLDDGRPTAELHEVGGAHVVHFAVGSSFRVTDNRIEAAITRDIPERLVAIQLVGVVM